MVNFSSVFLFVTAISAAVVPSVSRRDAAETLANLEAIDTSTKSLTTTVTNWDGSLLGALGINSAATDLENLIDTANTDAQAEVQASSADSTTIINYITGTLEPDIEASLQALVAKQSEFAAVGLTSTVSSTLTTLQTKTNALSATLVGISSSDTAAAAQAAADTINSDFNTALAVFSA